MEAARACRPRLIWPHVALPVMAALMAMLWAAPAAADEAPWQRHCRAELKAHCPRLKPGDPQALACLQKNLSHLTAACRKALQDLQPAAPAPPPPAPQPLVKPAPPAPATIVSMPPPRAKLPPPLHAPVSVEPTQPVPQAVPKPVPKKPVPKKPPRNAAAVLHACARDLGRICPGQRGEARVLGCLLTHERALTWRCRDALRPLEKRR
jgi:outer membrane biosynthesis protein TonB